MKTKTKWIIILSLAISIIGFYQVEAISGHSLEQRVAQLEAILTPTVANPPITTTLALSADPGEHPECQYMDIGTAEQPNFVVKNWCPSSHQYTYYIQDVRAVENSLVLVNVQHSDNIEDGPKCWIRDTGTLPFPAGSLVTTGFILECDNAIAVPIAGDKLIYTVLSATSIQ